MTNKNEKDKRFSRPKPIDEETQKVLFDEMLPVASVTECTGLVPNAPLTDSEIASYSDIYDIPLTKKNVNMEEKHEKSDR